jgi:hypothetical protein
LKGFTLPFQAEITHQLGDEFAALPAKRRQALGWKIWRRHAWLHLSGHARHLRPRMPASTGRVLWLYTWTTIGDALMDLSACHLFPPGLQVDLHIAPPLAPLFRHDPRFHRVLEPRDAMAPDDYDFVLVQDLHAATLKLKRQLAPHTPFASMLGYLHGEMFHRVAFAHRRLAQLLGRADPVLQAPQLHGIQPAGLARQALAPAATRIAIALGARDPRRRYSHWPAVMQQLLNSWPARLPAPQFILLGNGNAHEDFAAIANARLLPHCEMQLSCPSLGELAQVIASCDAFVGADGGLMHLALALQRPGVALFGPVPAQLRLSGGSSLLPLSAVADINRVSPYEVARLALSQLG